ncbi:MAG: hypothetical protein FJ088_03360, partial [Deltaproteobacteria bacterium]|nr:hypothetical protein [Deltaproteobacteria bacterium]
MERLKDNKGVALILVLASVAILAAFSSEFAYRNRVNIHIGTNIARDIQAYYHARSAMEVVRLVITSQKFVDNAMKMYSSMMPGLKSSNFELWPFACKFAEVFNTGTLNFLGVDLVKLKDVEGLGVEKGGFSCEIAPEDAKININNVRNASEKKLLVEKLYALVR